MSAKSPKAGDLIQTETGSTFLVMSPHEFNKTIGLAWVCPISSLPPQHSLHLKLPEATVIDSLADDLQTVRLESMRACDYGARKALLVGHVPATFITQCRSYLARIVQG